MSKHQEITKTTTDLFIIGGGINGVGIAADASQRGYSVTLCEQDDLACATSSASTKLIHGGLRYLEYYEFRLVREALNEREVLLKKAPHLIRPQLFIMPHSKHHRSAWLIRCGLWLYDLLGKRKRLGASKRLSVLNNGYGTPLKPEFHSGFSYYDCWVDDARLVVANAKQAREHGAQIFTHHMVKAAKRVNGTWEVTVLNRHTDQEYVFHARALVNASGPWLNALLEVIPNHIESRVQLVKGSHIIVKKIFSGDHAYILQNQDNRIIFAIPYCDEYTLIGTTDIPTKDIYQKPMISPSEIDYLCHSINQYFNKNISAEDVVWHYSGIRPLQADDREDPSAVTRDYSIVVEDDQNTAPLITILGGKITTYRKLAEHALNKLSYYFHGKSNVVTDICKLPGGDIPNCNMIEYFAAIKQQYPWLDDNLCHRYCHSYGSEIHGLLDNCHHLSDLGEHFGHGLFQHEVDYLIAQEWASSAEDILWRRSKLGLQFNDVEVAILQAYVVSQTSSFGAQDQDSSDVITPLAS